MKTNEILNVSDFNYETQELTTRAMTDEEKLERTQAQKQSQESSDAAAAVRVSALAKLSALGLTPQEIEAL